MEGTEVNAENSILLYCTVRAHEATMSSLKMASFRQGPLSQPCGSAAACRLLCRAIALQSAVYNCSSARNTFSMRRVVLGGTWCSCLSLYLIIIR